MVMKPRGSVIQRTKPSPRTEVSSEGGGGIPAPRGEGPRPGFSSRGRVFQGEGKAIRHCPPPRPAEPSLCSPCQATGPGPCCAFFEDCPPPCPRGHHRTPVAP